MAIDNWCGRVLFWKSRFWGNLHIKLPNIYMSINRLFWSFGHFCPWITVITRTCSKHRNTWLTISTWHRSPHPARQSKWQTDAYIRSIDHSNQAKLPSIIRKSTTSYSPVDTAYKDITLHFPTFQRCETNHSGRNKAPPSWPSFPAGKKSNHYFCLAFGRKKQRFVFNAVFMRHLRSYHYYHCYRNTHPGIRMTLCEEIERKIV